MVNEFRKKVITFSGGYEIPVENIKSVDMIFLLMAILKTHGAPVGEVKISKATAERIANIAEKDNVSMDDFVREISECKLIAENDKRKFNRPVFSYVEVDENTGDVYFEMSSAFLDIFDGKADETPAQAGKTTKKTTTASTAKTPVESKNEPEDAPF